MLLFAKTSADKHFYPQKNQLNFFPLLKITASFCHGLGSILLSMAVVDSWDCNMFWWVFAISSITPALVEIIATCMLVVLHNA